LNGIDGSLEAAQYNSDMLTMPVLLSSLEAAGWNPAKTPRIRYFVDAFTEETGFTDSIGDPFASQGLLSVDPRRPAITVGEEDSPSCFAGGFCNTLMDDQSGVSLTVRTAGAQLAGDKPLGVLMYHRNNVNGSRAQVVKIGTTTALGLGKTKEVRGFRDPA